MEGECLEPALSRVVPYDPRDDGRDDPESRFTQLQKLSTQLVVSFLQIATSQQNNKGSYQHQSRVVHPVPSSSYTGSARRGEVPKSPKQCSGGERVLGVT